MKQSLGLWHGHKRIDLGPTPGLTENGYIVGVSPKIGDVTLYPVQGSYNIQHTIIGCMFVIVTIGGKI